MDENAISVLCAIDGCDFRVVGDTRCPEHGGCPTYAWEPSIWGEDEYVVAFESEPVHPTSTVLEGHHA